MMKIVLTMYTILTMHAALAAESDRFTIDSRSCSSGAKLQEDQSVPTRSIRYSISSDRKTLIREIEVEGNIVTDQFSLSLHGKSNNDFAYLAIPKGQTIHPDYFYVTLTEDGTILAIDSADADGTACGGGIVISKLRKEVTPDDSADI